MALYKVDYVDDEGAMGRVFVGDDDTLAAEQVRDVVVDLFGKAGSAHRIDTHSISGSNSDGSPIPEDTITVESEEGTWVNYPLLRTVGVVEVYGTPSDLKRMGDYDPDRDYAPDGFDAPDADVDLEGQSHIYTGPDGLDKDDLARIADALQLAWDNANAGSSKNRDRAARAVFAGMRGAYSDTLAKVDRLLER